MNNILKTVIWVLATTLSSKGQVTCSFPLPKNPRPDTVSKFVFLNKSLEIKKIAKCKPLSSTSLKTRLFKISWLSINTTDIQNFVGKSIGSIKPQQLIDTLTCNIFGLAHNVVVIKSKGIIFLFIYLNQTGEQDIFLASLRRKKGIKQTISYLEKYLN